MSRGQLMLLMSALEILAVLPMAAFPALVPDFIKAWSLSNAEAGWITGCYYLGYLLPVTFAITLTDRVDARKVFVFGAFGTGIFTLAFGLLAEGFWTALVLRAFSGEWEGRKTPAGWVPSSGFPSEYEAERDRTEAEVADFTQRIASLKKELPGTRALRRKIEELKIERGGLSRALTERIHDAYRFERTSHKNV